MLEFIEVDKCCALSLGFYLSGGVCGVCYMLSMVIFLLYVTGVVSWRVENDILGLRYLKYCSSFGSASLVTTIAAFVGWTWSGILERRSLPWCGADKLKYLIKVEGMKPERIFFMDQKWAGRQCHVFSMDMCQMALLQSAQKFVGKFWYLVYKWSRTCCIVSSWYWPMWCINVVSSINIQFKSDNKVSLKIDCLPLNVENSYVP